MAGDWIKVETILPTKPEVLTLAAMLDTDPDRVVGMLIRFWIWADSVSENGHASVTLASVQKAGFAGTFFDGLQKVGWIIEEKNGIKIPNWDYHNGKSAKKRALDAKRQSRKRHATVTQASGQKADQRREEKNIKPPIPPLSGGTENASACNKANPVHENCRGCGTNPRQSNNHPNHNRAPRPPRTPDDWLAWGKSIGDPGKPGESMAVYLGRVRSLWAKRNGH